MQATAVEQWLERRIRMAARWQVSVTAMGGVHGHAGRRVKARPARRQSATGRPNAARLGAPPTTEPEQVCWGLNEERLRKDQPGRGRTATTRSPHSPQEAPRGTGGLHKAEPVHLPDLMTVPPHSPVYTAYTLF